MEGRQPGIHGRQALRRQRSLRLHRRLRRAAHPSASEIRQPTQPGDLLHHHTALLERHVDPLHLRRNRTSATSFPKTPGSSSRSKPSPAAQASTSFPTIAPAKVSTPPTAKPGASWHAHASTTIPATPSLRTSTSNPVAALDATRNARCTLDRDWVALTAGRGLDWRAKLKWWLPRTFLITEGRSPRRTR